MSYVSVYDRAKLRTNMNAMRTAEGARAPRVPRAPFGHTVGTSVGERKKTTSFSAFFSSNSVGGEGRCGDGWGEIKPIEEKSGKSTRRALRNRVAAAPPRSSQFPAGFGRSSPRPSSGLWVIVIVKARAASLGVV